MYNSPGTAMNPRIPYRGRGAGRNTDNRFEALTVERDSEGIEEDDPAPATRFFVDRSQSIISTNTSPDLGFDAGVNPYRGCEHGCAYCYARPTHEYLGLSAGLDFESKIFVKPNAAVLLRAALSAKGWKPRLVAMSGVTDCYQPVERRLRITRSCLEVFAEFRNPVGLITKNALVTRDSDVLGELARFDAVQVCLSVTTLNGELCRTLEPRSSQPAARLAAIRALAQAGIPVGINVAPVIPGLTDHEIPAILEASREAGASFASWSLVRLPHAVNPLFQEWLAHHRPDARERVLHRIRQTRDGALSESRFGHRGRGSGHYSEQIRRLFDVSKGKAGYPERVASPSALHFRRPRGPQLDLFEA